MTKNPFLNSLTAIIYIVCIILLIMYIPQVIGTGKDNILTPMAALSLFVLSAALMGYIFLYQPILMIVEGQKETGVKLFLKTVGIFACGTLAIFIISLIISN